MTSPGRGPGEAIQSSRTQHKLVAFPVFEQRRRAPIFLLGLLRELHALGRKLTVGGFDIVAGKGAVEETADPVLLPLRRKEHEKGLRVADAEFDPALTGP